MTTDDDRMKMVEDAIAESTREHEEWLKEYQRFNEDKLVACFTLFDNDFAWELRTFVSSFHSEFSNDKLKNHPTDKLTSYFTNRWEATCEALTLLKQIRGYHIVADGDDLYEPRGYGNSAKTKEYLVKKFKCGFAHDAQHMFMKYVSECGGNGEFVFVDHHGNMKSY